MLHVELMPLYDFIVHNIIPGIILWHAKRNNCGRIIFTVTKCTNKFSRNLCTWRAFSEPISTPKNPSKLQTGRVTKKNRTQKFAIILQRQGPRFCRVRSQFCTGIATLCLPGILADKHCKLFPHLTAPSFLPNFGAQPPRK
jgi:hypothetical protein